MSERHILEAWNLVQPLLRLLVPVSLRAHGYTTDRVEINLVAAGVKELDARCTFSNESKGSHFDFPHTCSNISSIDIYPARKQVEIRITGDIDTLLKGISTYFNNAIFELAEKELCLLRIRVLRERLVQLDTFNKQVQGVLRG